MNYVLLLRGINVGGNHKVDMAELKNQLLDAGFDQPRSYINSGNLFFQSALSEKIIREHLTYLFEQHYDFPIPFVMLSKTQLLAEAQALPDWWEEEAYRKNVLFYLPEADVALAQEQVAATGNERLYFGDYALFWTIAEQKDYSRSAYHKQLGKLPFYKQVSVRNANTFKKLVEKIGE